jgi:DNA-binding GntR family transcriptional regulator
MWLDVTRLRFYEISFNNSTIDRYHTRLATVSTVDDLARDRALLERSSTAERVAGVLRDRIMEGLFPPGTRLSEDAITAGLGISRNTLREAFRLLSHEKLLVHELNRGVFIRELDADDVIDLFRVRVLVECAAVRSAVAVSEGSLARLREAVSFGEQAAVEGRWPDVGTANMLFHQAIGGLLESPRVDELMRQLLAELRLVFLKMVDPRTFHEPYLRRNRDILELIASGAAKEAADALEIYLADAKAQLVAAFA